MKYDQFDLEKLVVGYEIPEYKVEISAQNYRKYNRLIKEINPLHTNKKYAQKMGYDTVIMAGNYLFTFIPKWLVDWIGDIEPIKKITIKFVNPVYPNDVIVHKGEIIKVTESNDSKIIECKYSVEKLNKDITANGKIILLFAKII